jgi:hypothetical protein
VTLHVELQSNERPDIKTLIFAADILILGKTRRKFKTNEVNGTSLYKKRAYKATNVRKENRWSIERELKL